ncbi:hypothetical protein L596_024504 [Steinernema carpocapsae]|nr:hypothetical protein L596_024504 [Steinernema carpocapsae]
MDQRVEQSVFEVWSEFKTDLRTYLKDPDYEKAVVDCFEKILLSLYDSVPKKTFAGTHQFFELCKESMLEALPYAFPTNCFELFRSKLCSTAVNWLVLFAEVPDSFIDKQMNELVLAADSGLTFSAKIPNKVTEWKLSKMISYTAVDRVISYALSHFLERKKDLVITGPPLSGKSTILREIVNYIVSTDETYEFHFFSIFDRSNLEVMQKKFYRVMRSLNPKKQSVLVIDSVRFVNALTPLLEMFLDQNLVMEKGVPVKWKTSIQLILVLDEVEFEICNKQELFTSKIVVVPVKATTEADAKFVLEQLFEWNLTVKTFSSEYQSILAPMAAASVSMIRFLKMELWLTMVHLAKGFMFAFPVNVPDVISMVRLWCHEAIRVMTDPLRSKPKKEALEFLKNELFKMNMTISALFEPLNGQRHYVDTEEHGDLRKINDAALNQVDRLNSLLFSELMTADAIDGLGYNVVPNRASLNRLVENIIYESSRGRSNVKIDIAITE